MRLSDWNENETYSSSTSYHFIYRCPSPPHLIPRLGENWKSFWGQDVVNLPPLCKSVWNVQGWLPIIQKSMLWYLWWQHPHDKNTPEKIDDTSANALSTPQQTSFSWEPLKTKTMSRGEINWLYSASISSLGKLDGEIILFHCIQKELSDSCLIIR